MLEKFIDMDDLEFGDILILRNDEKYVYVDKCMYGERDTYYHDGDTVDCYYTDFNSDSDDPEYDIVKVLREGKVIYEKTIREMTLKELCEKLGYEVKIIKERDDD